MLRRTPSQHGGDLSTFAPPASPLSSKNYHFSSGASRHRRPVTSEEKQYVCQYPGCGRAYFQKCSLQFHQTQKHGRKKTCERKRKSEMNDAIDSDMMKAVLLASRANPDDYKQQLASALHSLSKKVSPDNVGAGESFSQEHVLPDSDLRNNQSQQLDQSVLSPRSSIEKSHEIPDYKQQLNEALMSLSPTSPSKALYSGMEAENNKSGFRSPQGDQLAYEQDSFRSPMNPPQHTSYDSLSEQTAFSQTQLSVNAEGPLSPNVFRPPVHSPAYSQAPPNLLPQYSSVDSMPAHSLATQSPAVSLDPDSLPGSQQSFHTSPYSSTAMPRQYDSKDDPDQQEYRDFGGAVFPTSSSGSFMGSSN